MSFRESSRTGRVTVTLFPVDAEPWRCLRATGVMPHKWYLCFDPELPANSAFFSARSPIRPLLHNPGPNRLVPSWTMRPVETMDSLPPVHAMPGQSLSAPAGLLSVRLFSVILDRLKTLWNQHCHSFKKEPPGPGKNVPPDFVRSYYKMCCKVPGSGHIQTIPETRGVKGPKDKGTLDLNAVTVVEPGDAGREDPPTCAADVADFLSCCQKGASSVSASRYFHQIPSEHKSDCFSSARQAVNQIRKVGNRAQDSPGRQRRRRAQRDCAMRAGWTQAQGDS